MFDRLSKSNSNLVNKLDESTSMDKKQKKRNTKATSVIQLYKTEIDYKKAILAEIKAKAKQEGKYQGNGFEIFTFLGFGGDSIKVDGQDYLVPNRIAKIYNQLISSNANINRQSSEHYRNIILNSINHDRNVTYDDTNQFIYDLYQLEFNEQDNQKINRAQKLFYDQDRQSVHDSLDDIEVINL